MPDPLNVEADNPAEHRLRLEQAAERLAPRSPTFVEALRARGHVLAFLRSHPWAMLPEAFETMLSILAGQAIATPDVLRAAFGGQPDADDDNDGEKPYPVMVRTAVIPVFGVIGHRMNMMSRMSGGTSTQQIARDVTTASLDPDVDSIVLDINSPGGGVYGLREAHGAIRRAREEKRIIAHINGLGASAAYWLASGAHEIAITPSGEAGSIGIFGVHEDWSQHFADRGIKPTVFRAGAHKNDDNPYEALTDSARKALQARVDEYYGYFVADVAEGRQTTAAKVRAGYGEGWVLTAPAALEAGMVDRMVEFDEVLDELAQASLARSIRARDESRRAALASARHAITVFDLTH
jgi:capsid assembly protease